MKKNIFLLLLVSYSAFTANAQSKKKNNINYLNELVTIMQGHYSSEKQSVADTTYFNISLRMVPIWKNKGHYLYVEQAIFKKQDKPYRVRIYKLVQNGEEFISEIYTLKNEKDWIGKWNAPEAFDALTENDIEQKKGCEVVLKRIGKNKFAGQTGIKTCSSELRGANYATSKVTVLENQILSWDQGFDKEGKQVWGAEKAGYIFDKL
jgi:hypothetical protein